MKSDVFLRNLLTAAQRHRRTTDPAAAIDQQIAKLEKEKNRAAELALTSDSDTFIALVEERSRHIESLRREVRGGPPGRHLVEAAWRATVHIGVTGGARRGRVAGTIAETAAVVTTIAFWT